MRLEVPGWDSGGQVCSQHGSGTKQRTRSRVDFEAAALHHIALHGVPA